MFSYDVVTLIFFILLIILGIPTAIAIIISAYYVCFLWVCAMMEDITEQIARIRIKKKNKKNSKSIDKNKKV